MTERATIRESVEEPWLKISSMTVGRVPTGRPTPDAYVTVERDGAAHLRIDAYAQGSSAFTELIFWQRFLVLAWTDIVHLIDIDARTVRDVPCKDYFGHLYSFPDHLLIASGQELIRCDAGGNELWRRDWLGIDGVIIDEVRPDGVIVGQGEWDPPDGWRPFRVRLADGSDAPVD
jgi:hypothetical protein